MNGILKKGAILILAIMVLLAMLVACDGKDGESSTSQESSSSSEESSTPESSEEPPAEDAVPVEQIEAFIELLGSNYTYTSQDNSSDYKKWYVLLPSNIVYAPLISYIDANSCTEPPETYHFL